jgi:hypothetical protein
VARFAFRMRLVLHNTVHSSSSFLSPWQCLSHWLMKIFPLSRTCFLVLTNEMIFDLRLWWRFRYWGYFNIYISFTFCFSSLWYTRSISRAWYHHSDHFHTISNKI